MKLRNLLVVALGLGALTALAQDQPRGRGGPGGPPGGGRPPVFPIMAALDTNSDGELSSNEIAHASAALKTLDKNGDGKLSAEELMPPPPDGADMGLPPGGDVMPPPPGRNQPTGVWSAAGRQASGATARSCSRHQRGW